MLNWVVLLGALAVAYAHSVRGALRERFISSFLESEDPISFLEYEAASAYLNDFATKKANGAYQSVTASTKYGTVQGIDDGRVTQFLGVPFAKPPVGDLRLKAPQPPDNWGHIMADEWKPGCMQPKGIWTLLTGMDEDCLHMNFYLPSGTVAPPPPGGWPIMMFFYGGSYRVGAAGFPLYHGHFAVDSLLGTNHNVMIVTINYRVGAFGFLASEALRQEDPDGAVGNYGFLDQRQAMRFLQEVAPAFGGNPNLITIYGESAGAGSVSAHLVSPRSHGLFHRVIAQSGALASDWVAQPFDLAAIKAQQLVENAGCDGKPTYAEEMACLRALSAEDMVDAWKRMPSPFLQWAPVIDGVDVPDHPRRLMNEGKIIHDVPVILGSTRDEGTQLLNEPVDLPADKYYSTLLRYVGEKLAPEVEELYPLSDFDSPWWGMVSMFGDAEFICPSRESAIALTKRTPTFPATNTYLYNFACHWDVIKIYDMFGKKPLGAFHGSELLAVFNAFHALPFLAGPGELEFSNLVTRYWSRFAWSGNPNGDVVTTDPVWTKYNATLDNVAELNVVNGTARTTMVTGLRKKYCDYWEDNPVDPENIFI